MGDGTVRRVRVFMATAAAVMLAAATLAVAAVVVENARPRESAFARMRAEEIPGDSCSVFLDPGEC